MSMFTDEEIGDVVADIRHDAGMTQGDVARMMRLEGFKWSQATMWSIEAGVRPLRLREAVELASILNTDLDELLGGDAPQKSEFGYLLDEAMASIEEYRRKNGRAV